MKNILTLCLSIICFMLAQENLAQTDAPIHSTQKESAMGLNSDSLNFSEFETMKTSERLKYFPTIDKAVVYDQDLNKYFVFWQNQWVNVSPNTLQNCQIQIAIMRKQIAKLQDEVEQLKSNE